MRLMMLSVAAAACSAAPLAPQAPAPPPPAAAQTLSLAVSPLEIGSPATIEVFGAEPGALVEVMSGDGAPVVGACPPPLPVEAACLSAGTSGVEVAFAGVADDEGARRWTLDTLPELEGSLWLQAVQLAPVANTSNPVLRDVVSCVADPAESNDDLGIAWPLPPGLHGDWTACPLDEDWYATEVPPGHALRVVLEHDATEGDLDIELHGPGGLLDASYTAADTEVVDWTNQTADPVTLYTRVSPYADAGVTPGNQYALRVERGLPASCSDDPFEDDDDLATARVELGPSTSCPGDEDWFAIQLQGGNSLELTVEAEELDGQLELSLFDDAGIRLDRTSQAPLSLATLAARSGTVFARVTMLHDDVFGGGVAYDLLPAVHKAGLCVDDAHEDDDSEATASLLVNSGSGRSCAGDADWWAIDVREGTSYALSVSSPGPDQRVDATLFDQDGSVLAADTSGHELELLAVATEDTRWHLRVTHDVDTLAADGVPYLVIVDDAACAEDGHEDDDDAATAYPLQAGHARAGRLCGDDEDWFSIDVAEEDNLVVTLEAETGEIGLQLFAPDGALLRTDYDGSVTWLSATAGTYTVRAWTPAAAEAGYLLRAEAAGPAPCATDPFEPNDSFSEAMSLTSGTYDVVACPTDDDWFTIDLLAGDHLDVLASFEDIEASQDIDLFLFRPDGILASVADRNGASSEQLQHIATLDGTYALRMVAASDDPFGGGVSASLVIDAVRPRPCVSDPREDDDTPGQASPLQGVIDGTACERDVDWYAVSLEAGQTLSLDLAWSEAEGLLDVAVHNGGLALVAQMGSGDHEVSWTTDEATDVYVSVSLLADDRTAGGVPYTLTPTIVIPSPCPVDALEPNDGFSTATSIVPGSLSAVGCLGDSDWYEFSVAAGELFSTELDWSTAPPVQRLSLYLYDEAGNLVQAASDQLPARRDDVGGTWRVEVRTEQDDPAGGGVPYTLDLAVAPPTPCTTDGYEPNDERDASADLSTGEHAATICRGEADWYRFDADAGSQLTLTLRDGSDANTTLALYDSAGRLLTRSSRSSYLEEIERTLGSTDAYFVRVTAHAFSADVEGGDYTLTLDLSSGETCLADALEPDNTLGTATIIAGPSWTGTATACPNDPDVYAVALTTGQTLQADYNGDRNGAELYLLDEGGRTLEQSQWYTLEHTARADQTVYAWVHPDSMTTAAIAYTLDLEVVTPQACVDDGLEPNNDQDTATLLTPGATSATSCASNVDVYALDLESGELVEAMLTGPTGSERASLLLVDASGTQLDGVSGTRPGIGPWIAPTDGRVYLEVRLLEDDVAAGGFDYMLDVEVTPTAPCAADLLEPNDDFASAAPLEAGSFDAVACTTDADWYHLPANPGDVVAVDLQYDYGERASLSLYDAGGELLDYSDSSWSTRQYVSHRVTADGGVFVQVQGIADDVYRGGIAYTLWTTHDRIEDCFSDPLEDDDDMASATLAADGDRWAATICGLDPDYIAIPLQPLQTLVLTVTDHTGDLRLELLDAAGEVLSEDSYSLLQVSYSHVPGGAPGDSGADTGWDDTGWDDTYSGWDTRGLLPLGVTAPATVYARVRGEEGFLGVATASYDVHVEIYTASPCTPDVDEPNDTLLDATVLTGTTRTATGCVPEEDWYAFDVAAGQQVDASVLWQTSNEDLDLYLYDAAGAEVDASTLAYGRSVAVGPVTADADGTWYLRIVARADDTQGGGVAYDLTVDVHDPPSCPPDPHEPNDTQAEATPLALGTVEGIVCAADVDMYVLDGLAGDTVELALSGSSYNERVALALYRPDGTILAEDDGNRSASLNTVLESDGLHHLQVSGTDDDGAGIPYSLQLERTRPRACIDDSFEDDDDRSMSTPMMTGTFRHAVACDTDVVAIALEAGQTAQVWASYDTRSASLSLELIAEDGGRLDIDAYSDLNVEYTAAAASTVYAQISLDADDALGGGAQYLLEVDISDTSAPATCAPDGREPDDQLQDATRVGPGLHNARGCTGDGDWYAFEVTEGSVVFAELEYSGSYLYTSLDLELLNGAGARLGSTDPVGPMVAPSDDTWYLRVDTVVNSSGEGVPYTLDLDVTVPAVCVVDAHEPNDDEASAIPLTGEIGATACLSDMDWYQFDALAGDWIELTLSVEDYRNHSAGIVVYDPSGAVLWTGSTDGWYSSRRFDDQVMEDGTYTVRILAEVDDIWGGGIDYGLELEQIRPQPCVVDEHEDDDDFGAATLVGTNSQLSAVACEGDLDLFAFPLLAGQSVEILIDDDYRFGDVQWRLLNATGALLSTFSVGSTYNSLGYTATNDETVYLEVEIDTDDRAGGGAPYALDVTIVTPAPCLADGFEPNDDDTMATVLDAGRHGAVACVEDEDWYAIALSAGDVLEIDVDLDTGGDVGVYLYDPALVLQDSDRRYWSSQRGLGPFAIPTAGTYYLLVDALADDRTGGGTVYDVEVTITPPVACPVDAYEPNDTQATAAPLTEGLLTADGCASEEDWYVFSGLMGDEIDLSLRRLGSYDEDVDLELYSAGGTLLTHRRGMSGYHDIYDYVLPADGDYSVRVLGVADDIFGGGMRYSLSFSLFRPPPCVEDPREDDDTPLAATPVADGVSIQGQVCEGDLDYFAIDVQPGDIVTARVDYQPGDGNLSLSLRDDRDVALATQSWGSPLEVEYRATVAETLYTRVELTADDVERGGASYGIQFQVDRPDACAPDGFEPNDTRGTATAAVLGLGVSATACDDIDWYMFTAEAGDRIDLAVELVDDLPGESIEIALLDDRLLTERAASYDTTISDWIAEESGTYYARVRQLGDDIRGGGVVYRLRIDVEPPDPCVVDAHEPNDALELATPITDGRYSATACLTDADWFAIDATAGTRILFDRLSHLQTGEAVTVRLFEADGTLLDTGDGWDNIDRAVDVTATYFLKIIADSDDPTGGGVAYDFDVEVREPAPCATDAFEPNDDESAATLILSGSHQASGCPSDEDWFAFDAAAGDYITVSYDFNDWNGEDIDVELIGPTGQVLDHSTDWYDSYIGPQAAPEDGTYLLRFITVADDPNGGGVSYGFTLGISSPDPCLEDSWEPNDDAAAAAPIGSGTHTGTVCLDDDDWFAVTGLAGDHLDIRLDLGGFTYEEDADIYLYGPDGALLASGEGVRSYHDLELTLPADGDYLVHVVGVLDDSDGGGIGWTLTVDQTTPLPCPVDVYEPNDGPWRAALFTPGSHPATACTTDSDWFVLTAFEGDIIDIDIDVGALTSGESLAVYLRDAAGTLHDSDTWGTVRELDLTTPWDGLWYVEIVAPQDDVAGGGIDYTAVVAVHPPVTCVADRFEPDNAPAGATPLPRGVTANLTACAEDLDYWRIDLDAGQAVQIDFDVVSGDGRAELTLRDAGGRELDQVTSTSSNLATYAAPRAETIYAVVDLTRDSTLGGGVGYRLDAGFQRGPACVADTLEPNDRPSTAAVLTEGRSNATSCGDDDWYALSLQAGEIVDLTVATPRRTWDEEVRATLYTPSGDILATRGAAWGDAIFDPWVAAEGGTHYLLVSLQQTEDGTGVDYTVDLAVEAPAPCGVDPFEPNDEAATATVVRSRQFAASGCTDDVDWYAFSASAGQELQVQLTYTYDLFDPTDSRLVTEILDPSGEVVATGPFPNPQVVPLSTSGLHHVRVTTSNEPLRGGGVPYDLSVDLRTPPACTDAFEPNDDAGLAPWLAPGSHSALACADDVDWYRVHVPAGERLALDVLVTETTNTWVGISLFDASMASLGSGFAYDRRAFDVTAPQSTAGETYWLQVTNSGPDRRVAYQVDVDLQVPGACVTDALEPNDSPLQVAPLTDGLTATACVSDADWYAFDGAVGDHVAIAHSYNDAGGQQELDARLYAPDGTEMEQSTGSYGALAAYLPMDGIYLLEVTARFDDAPGGGIDYSLGFSLTLDAACPADEWEDDDLLTSATPIGLSEPVQAQACEGDDDFWAIDLDAQDYVTVSVSSSSSDGYVGVQLLAADGTVLHDRASTTNVEFSHEATSEETLYVRVWSSLERDVYLGAAYTLEATHVGICLVDAFGDISTRDEAAELAPGGYAGLALCATSQSDYFDIPLAAGQTLTVDARFRDADGNVDLWLVGATNRSANTETDHERLAYTATIDEVVSLEVELDDDDGVLGTTYDLWIRIEEP